MLNFFFLYELTDEKLNRKDSFLSTLHLERIAFAIGAGRDSHFDIFVFLFQHHYTTFILGRNSNMEKHE